MLGIKDYFSLDFPYTLRATYELEVLAADGRKYTVSAQSHLDTVALVKFTSFYIPQIQDGDLLKVCRKLFAYVPEILVLTKPNNIQLPKTDKSRTGEIIMLKLHDEYVDVVLQPLDGGEYQQSEQKAPDGSQKPLSPFPATFPVERISRSGTVLEIRNCGLLCTFAYAKQKNVAGAKAAPDRSGDAWTWVAIDADTKLVASWRVGDPSAETAMEFVSDLGPRLRNRVQITSDGYKPYLEAIEGVFGGDVDYAMLVKHYGAAPEGQPLQSRCLHWCREAPHRRQPGRAPRQYKLCRKAKFDDENEHPPVYASHKRLLEKA